MRSELKIVRFTFNMFSENCYVVYSPESREAMIVDPGMLTAEECNILDRFIDENRLTVKYQVNTHLHLDHCFGAAHVESKYGVKTSAHSEDLFLGQSVSSQASAFGINQQVKDITEILPLDEGDKLSIGRSIIEIIHLPGHSPGGIALYSPADGWVITGDSLFRSSIGRTDLPGGDYARLIKSVSEKILTLPPETTVFPGHGPQTTVEFEMKTNPYL